MPAIFRNASKGTGFCALVMLVVSMTPAGVGPITKLPREGYLGDAALIMLVQTKATLSNEVLLRTLNEGLKESGCTIEGGKLEDKDIRAVPASFYEEFDNLVYQTPVGAGSDLEAPLVPRRIPARELLWEFRTRQATEILKKLKVTYKKAGVKEYEPKDPILHANAALTLTALGRYALRPESDDEPESYETTLANLNKPDETVKENWPTHDRFYVITLRNFKGPKKHLEADRDLFFWTVKRGRTVTEPLKHVRLGPDLTFVFAKLGIDTPPPGESYAGNELHMRINAPDGRKGDLKRVWVLFPLTAENYLKARDDYRKFGAEKLPEEIRKNNVPIDKKFEIGPASEPRWIELTSQDGGVTFSRVIPLTEQDKFREKYKQVFRLRVYEHNNGNAIFVGHPQHGQVRVFEDELKGINPGLDKTPKSK